jgi:glycosyltransferase involved in cell wall biosynthesis
MVSVIIPTYNYGRFIAETLDSVRAQTYKDFECLVIDNGSTDDTTAVVAPFLTDERFKYCKIPNKGVSAARNFGVKIARGELIQFLDADDLLESDKLRMCVNHMSDNADTALTYSDMRYFKDPVKADLYYSYQCDRLSDKPWMHYGSGGSDALLPRLLEGNFMVISSPLVRKSAFEEAGGFDETLRYNEDWDLWLRILLNGGKFQYVEGEGTRSLVRVHAYSASRDIFGMQVSGLKVLLKNAAAIKNSSGNGRLISRIQEHIRTIRGLLLESNNEELKTRLDLIKEKNAMRLIFMTEKLPFVLMRKWLWLLHKITGIYGR